MPLQVEHNWDFLFLCFREVASISILMKKIKVRTTQKTYTCSFPITLGAVIPTQMETHNQPLTTVILLVPPHLSDLCACWLLFPSLPGFCVHMCICAQSCPTLCHTMYCSPPDSFVHGIFQARILEQVAISSSRGFSQPGDGTHISCISFIGR